MNRAARFFRRMQIYHVRLLASCAVLLLASRLLGGMVWTRYYVDYSHMLAHLTKCLRFAGQTAGLLWGAFCVKHITRRLQLYLARRKPRERQNGEAASSTTVGRLLWFFKHFQGRKTIDRIIRVLRWLTGKEALFKILYFLMDAAAIALWCALAATFVINVQKSSSPVYFSRVFTREGTFPYTIFNLLPVAGLALGGGALLYVFRRFKDTFMCIWQAVVLYAVVDAACMLSLMVFKKDITVVTEWVISATTVYLMISITFGILRHIRRLGKINFAKIHPLIPGRKKENTLDDEIQEEAPAKAVPVAAVDHAAQTASSAKESAEQAEPDEKAAAPVREEPARKAPEQRTNVAVGTEDAANVEAAKAEPAKTERAQEKTVQKKAEPPHKAPRRKKTFQERTGLSFKSMWTIHFALQMIPYCALLIAAVLYLSTTLYTIKPYEQALVYRFGRLQEESITDPGLHVKLPVPIDQVEIYDVSRMKSMHVGYTPAQDTSDYLWTSEHGGEEYTLLLGNGNELVAVNMRLNYMIDNLMHYKTCFENPESMLSARAYAIMMERTIVSDLDTVLSVDRSSLADAVRDELNAFSDEMHLGLNVANVIIENIHPPVELAEVYQNVINASIQKTTMTSSAQAYASETVGAAQRQQTAAIAAATKTQTERLAAAKSEAEVFAASGQAYAQAPQSYALLKLTNAYRQLIPGARLYVFSPGTRDMMDRFLIRNGQNAAVIGQ